MRRTILKKSVSVFDCKKGQYLQFMLIVVILIVLSIVMLGLMKFQSSINTAIQDNVQMDNHSKENSLNQTNATGDVFDTGVVIVLLFALLTDHF